MEQKVKLFAADFAAIESKSREFIDLKLKGVEESDLLYFVEVNEAGQETGKEVYASVESVYKLANGNSRIRIDYHEDID